MKGLKMSWKRWQSLERIESVEGLLEESRGSEKSQERVQRAKKKWIEPRIYWKSQKTVERVKRKRKG